MSLALLSPVLHIRKSEFKDLPYSQLIDHGAEEIISKFPETSEHIYHTIILLPMTQG